MALTEGPAAMIAAEDLPCVYCIFAARCPDDAFDALERRAFMRQLRGAVCACVCVSEVRVNGD